MASQSKGQLNFYNPLAVDARLVNPCKAPHKEVFMSGSMETLNAIREFAGPRQTLGIDDATLERFWPSIPASGGQR